MTAWKTLWLDLSFPNQPAVKKYLLSTYYVLGQDCGLRSHADLGLNLSSTPSQLCDLVCFLNSVSLSFLTSKMGLVLGPTLLGCWEN